MCRNIQGQHFFGAVRLILTVHTSSDDDDLLIRKRLAIVFGTEWVGGRVGKKLIAEKLIAIIM